MSSPQPAPSPPAPGRSRTAKILSETAGLLRGPHRVFPLAWKLGSDKLRASLQQRHLYAYANTTRPSDDALNSVIAWIRAAQRADGGIAAYYSLLTGYAESYPEVTGYIVPTLYDYADAMNDPVLIPVAQRATQWLLSLQM